MEDYQPTPEADRIHFAVLAIEAGAKKMGISAAEMRKRLDKQNLIKHYILRCYDVFHTMSLEHVAEDVVEALQNWEAASTDSSNEKGGNK